MKKSRLRDLKTIKTNRKFSRVRGRITSGPEKLPACRLTIPVGSFENIASDIYNNPQFQQIFSHTNSVDDEEITFLIEDTLRGRRVPVLEVDRVTLQVRMYLRKFVAGAAKDSELYDYGADAVVNQVYLETHDIFGNLY